MSINQSKNQNALPQTAHDAQSNTSLSPALLRQLFDSNLIGAFVADFAGTFLDANDAFLNLLGYTREELLAGNIRRDDLTPPEFHFLSQKALKALRETGASDIYEKEFLHKSDQRIPVLVAVKRIEQTDTCIGFVLDITERKRAEEQEHFLSEVSKVLSSTLDYQETLANIARLVVPQLADWFSVDLVDDT